MLDDADVPEAVTEALCDDLNAPLAFSEMHAMADRAMAGDFETARPRCLLQTIGAFVSRTSFCRIAAAKSA